MADDSALLTPFPEVDAAVAAYRQRLDPVAAIGVPAHVTIHYPWLPVDTVDDAVLAEVRGLAAAVDPFTVTFAETRWFDEPVLWLAPSPDRELRELSDRSAGVWPDVPRYGGQFDDVVPHLTVGVGDASALRRAEAELTPALPLRTRATHLWWMVRLPAGRWVCREAFPLGG